MHVIQALICIVKFSASLSQSGGEAMRVTPSMWLCSRIMHALRDLHPTLLAALEGIVDQVRIFLYYVWQKGCLKYCSRLG